jgi:hypothetical protein
MLSVPHEVWDDAIASSATIDALTESGDLAFTIGHTAGTRPVLSPVAMSRKIREVARTGLRNRISISSKRYGLSDYPSISALTKSKIAAEIRNKIHSTQTSSSKQFPEHIVKF